MTNTRRYTEQLEVKLSEMDKVRAGARLADLCAKKDAAVAAKQSAMSHHAAHIKEIDEAIQQATGVVIRGYERRLVECEWRFHDPREDYKTLYRLDLGEPVTVEEMTFADKQGSLFPEAEAQPEQAWPVAINGVYPDDQAEVLAHEFGDGSSAKLRVLQVGEDRWTSSYDFATSGREAAFAGELEYGYDDKSREASIRSAAEVAIYEIRAIAANMKSDGVRAQLEAIQEWFRGQGGYIALAEQSGGSAWPVRLPDGTWDFKDAARRVYEKPSHNLCVKLYALEVQPDVWLRGWVVALGDKIEAYPIGKGDEAIEVDRLGEDAPDAYDSAQEAIAEAASDVLDLLDKWESSPAVVRASKWCDLVMEGKTDEEITEAMRWPVAVDGLYPVDEAQLLMREFEDGSVAKIYVLQVSEYGWVSGYSFTVGDVTRDLAPESGWIPNGSSDRAIRDAASEARDAIRDIRDKLKGAKAKEQFAAVDAWFAEQLELTQGPRTWPQPNEHGVYSGDGAEVLKPSKLPKGAEAEIRVLQVGPAEWIAADRLNTSAGARSGPLMRGDRDCLVCPSREQAIRQEAARIVHWVEGRLAGEQSKTARAQSLAIGTWAKALVVEMEQAAEDAERAAVEDVIASQISEENGNGLAEEFGALDQTAAETARQAVAAAEQYRAKATGAADWQ